jgi:hypothetical protein
VQAGAGDELSQAGTETSAIDAEREAKNSRPGRVIGVLVIGVGSLKGSRQLNALRSAHPQRALCH